MNLLAQSANNKRGITLIELLLVIAIIAIISVSSSPFLSRFILQNNLDNGTKKIVSTLRKAQAYSMDQKAPGTFGICNVANSIILYSQSCVPANYLNTFSIPSTVTISNLSSTTFNIRGEPATELTITLSTAIDTKSISVNSAGGISVN